MKMAGLTVNTPNVSSELTRAMPTRKIFGVINGIIRTLIYFNR